MNTELIKKYSVKFTRARGALLTVCILTAVNILLMAFGAEFYLLYSAIFPQIIFIVLADFGLFTVGLIIALTMTAVYLLFWGLSGKRRVFIMVALILFSLDALLRLFAIAFMMFIEVDLWLLIETAISIAIIVSLAGGTVAWVKLKNISPEELRAVQDIVNQEEENSEIHSAVNEIAQQQQQEQSPYHTQPQPMYQQQQSPYHTQPQPTYQQQQSPYHTQAQPTYQQQPQYISPQQTQNSYVFQVDDTFKTKVIEQYRRGTKVDKLYLFDDINPKKFGNAVKSYAQSLEPDETVILHYDETSFGSGKEGLILTSKRLYFRNSFQAGDVVGLSKIEKITYEEKKVLSTIFIKAEARSDIELLIADRTRVKPLSELINAIIDLMRSR